MPPFVPVKLDEKSIAFALRNSNIPFELQAQITDWLLRAKAPQPFLAAFLRNDLRAVVEASVSFGPHAAYLDSLRPILTWFEKNAPINCWGSDRAFIFWTSIHLAKTKLASAT